MVDDGHAIHYNAVERGTPIYAADGTEVGTVAQIVDNYREHILDGIVIDTKSGKRVFVDGPEVRRTAERGVTLAIEAAAVEELPPPEEGPGTFKADVSQGRVRRLFGRGWKRD
jgi:hypothetical protein